MTYLGLDVAQAHRLADLVAQWPGQIDDVVHTLSVAQNLSELTAGIDGDLVEISIAGRTMAMAIRHAIEIATSFTIDPRLALFLDRPVGSTYNPATANAALGAGETYRQTEIRGEIATLTAQLGNVPPGRRDELQAQITALRAEHQAIDPPTNGDPGGTLTAEVRTPFAPLGSTPYALGASIVAHALADTSEDDEIRLDEFQVIFHDNGNVTLVIPGVIDLMPPKLGLDSRHHTARDTDQHALPSSFNSNVDSNVFAQLIVQWLETQVANGVISPGTNLMIVGHSFGADTALDLASDAYVNGELVNITHVIPVAYHSEPQLDDVVNGTQVGVFQNIYDVPVIAEGLGADATGVALGALGPLVEPMGGTGAGMAGLARPFIEIGEEYLSFATQTANSVGGAINTHPATQALPPQVRLPSLPTDIEIVGDIVRVVPGQGFVAEFEGGFEGFGHHQNNYIDYIENGDLPEVIVTMLTDIGEAGYGAPGISLAIDVSVPQPVVVQPPLPTRTPTPSPLPVAKVELVNPITSFEPVIEPLAPLLERFESLVPEPVGDN